MFNLSQCFNKLDVECMDNDITLNNECLSYVGHTQPEDKASQCISVVHYTLYVIA